MRINKFIAQATGLGRRAADAAITAGLVRVNGEMPSSGMNVRATDKVTFNGRTITIRDDAPVTIMLNKPAGYVVSRNGQGSKTIYDLLPPEHQQLKPVGRLDKNSSGLLLLTSDGRLANELTHPSHQKVKVYEVALNQALQPLHQQMISDHGVLLDDGPSKFQLEPMDLERREKWRVIMHEGRNRQIRRTFKAVGYTVQTLHRIRFGPYQLGSLPVDAYQQLDS